MMHSYKQLSIVLSLLLSAGNLRAQHARFISSGTIRFEKQVNMYASIATRMSSDDGRNSLGDQVFDKYKSTQPQFKTYIYELSFNSDHSSYKPIDDPSKAVVSNWSYLERDPAVDHKNTVYTDLKDSTRLSRKNIYDEWFTVSDSLRNIRWKLTDEHREIAGYDCRRANGLTMDSIYIVAFYTDQIPVSGGPESFYGLPGMILGLALPYDHVTWFATKVTDQPVAATSLNPPAEKKVMNKAEFTEKINGIFDDWGGKYVNVIKKALLL